MRKPSCVQNTFFTRDHFQKRGLALPVFGCALCHIQNHNLCVSPPGVAHISEQCRLRIHLSGSVWLLKGFRPLPPTRNPFTTPLSLLCFFPPEGGVLEGGSWMGGLGGGFPPDLLRIWGGFWGFAFSCPELKEEYAGGGAPDSPQMFGAPPH